MTEAGNTENGYVELRTKSAFSFLQGTSLPEDLIARAAALGQSALALADQGNLAGAVRFHQAAKEVGLRAIHGAEVMIDGHPLLLLCETRRGYQNLSRLLSDMHILGPRTYEDLAQAASGLSALTGGVEGAIGQALLHRDPTGAAKHFDRLVGIFGRDHLAAEIQIHLEETEDQHNSAILDLAARHRIPAVLTNDVRYAPKERADLLDAFTCIRQKCSLAQAGRRLLQNSERHLKSARQMAALAQDLPEALAQTVVIADRCRFCLSEILYTLPQYPLPPGEDENQFLRALVDDAAPLRFSPFSAKARAQLERELALIQKLGLSGYFLIVWDIVQFCKSRNILIQGRGSAANSAVCYALSITACDPLKYDLLFERFLSEERGQWPDIDLDLPSGEDREEVIQYMYRKYGQRGAAMTAVAITYRFRSAVKDIGKVLALPAQVLDSIANTRETEASAISREAGLDPRDPRSVQLFRLCNMAKELPRHLSQHPGGMVLCSGRLDEMVPLQPATMPGRVIVQWDKDDCADMKMLKIDLLGLGMLAALAEARELCPKVDGTPFDIAGLPADDPGVYESIQKADTIGVFQVESRAQMATLPRMRPRCFYDLVVEVALIRPGPVIGQMVHPYLRRRSGQEPIHYLHPSLQPILERTLGVPLFQEQIMRVAMVAAGFCGGQAEVLRRAMGSKSGTAQNQKKMAQLEDQLVAGMAQNGIAGSAAEEIVKGIRSFAAYGFPESHAISFALLTYASAYLKVHHPAIFYATLLNAWPMGFYHPATLVQDALRHQVQVLPIDINHSEWRSRPLLNQGSIPGPSRTLRLGLHLVRSLRRDIGLVLAKERGYGSLAEVRRKCPAIHLDELSRLAEIGALGSLTGQPSRREALWQVSGLTPKGRLLDPAQEKDRSPLREMTQAEELQADYAGTSLTVGPHPMALLRKDLKGVLSANELATVPHGTRVEVAGMAIVRQRPSTAKGTFFLTLEDETGLINLVFPSASFEEHQRVLATAPALRIVGTVQKEQGGLSIIVRGQQVSPLSLRINHIGDIPSVPSHDFH